MVFANRREAGEKLAERLSCYQGEDVVVYGLPRGGVVVAFEVAKRLKAPLDIIITRKIGHPYNSEYAVCAVTEQGDLFCNESERGQLDDQWFWRQVKKEKKEAARRRKVYFGDRKHILADGKTAIIVDDGIATGLTMRAALESLKKENPKKIIVAMPVAPRDVVLKLKKQADQVVVLEDAEVYLGAVGAYYNNFGQVTDQEVIGLLRN